MYEKVDEGKNKKKKNIEMKSISEIHIFLPFPKWLPSASCNKYQIQNIARIFDSIPFLLLFFFFSLTFFIFPFSTGERRK